MAICLITFSETGEIDGWLISANQQELVFSLYARCNRRLAEMVRDLEPLDPGSYYLDEEKRVAVVVQSDSANSTLTDQHRIILPG